jgi:hypothetical protein
MLVGDALGRAMIELESGSAPYSVDAGEDMITWSGEPVELDAVVQDITVESYAWTADPDAGVGFSSETVEDPTVTITKPTSALSAVTIVNPSFESPAKADAYYSVDLTDCPGWTRIDNGGFIGVWDIPAANYGGNAPEGENIAYANSDGFEQTLTQTLAADTTYTLTVEVGNRTGFAWTGYKVQLLADETVLDEDNNTVAIADNTFKTSTVTYAYDSGQSALLGQPLKIRLLCLDGNEVNFDNVELTTEGPIPDPYAVKLTLTVNDVYQDNMIIDVYDDACKAAKAAGLAGNNPADFDGNCITDFRDLAMMAEKWLNHGGLTAPVVK